MLFLFCMNTSAFTFVFERDLCGLSKFIENGGDVNEVETGHRTSLLIQAAYTEQHEMVKYLVKKGAQINYADEFGQTALHYAVYVGKPRMVSNIERRSLTSQVKILLDLGADINIASSSGLTPVSLATRKKVVSVMSLFNQVLNVPQNLV